MEREEVDKILMENDKKIKNLKRRELGYSFFWPKGTQSRAQDIDFFRDIVRGKYGKYDQFILHCPDIFIDTNQSKEDCTSWATEFVFGQYTKIFGDTCEIVQKNIFDGSIDPNVNKISIVAYVRSFDDKSHFSTLGVEFLFCNKNGEPLTTSIC